MMEGSGEVGGQVETHWKMLRGGLERAGGAAGC